MLFPSYLGAEAKLVVEIIWSESVERVEHGIGNSFLFLATVETVKWQALAGEAGSLGLKELNIQRM